MARWYKHYIHMVMSTLAIAGDECELNRSCLLTIVLEQNPQGINKCLKY